ncbi:MAG TPA: Type 1 glutamine amidotransferase-like domain-containing protein [Candidatus Limnocylindrales bacterium]|nr:Type 1 glutamine amidotransferase-like domain-containing protein [Candidatus Limnocylindrales bacterium]
MVKLYFLGGEDLVKRDSERINRKAFADAGGAPTVLVFIGWASRSVDEGERYRRVIVDYFEELGAKKIVFAELSDLLEDIGGKMENADLIYLPGGDPKLLVERIRKKGVDYLLRRYDKVIVGNSAGALALCGDCLIVGGGTQEETRMISGIGAADFCVDVHYNSSKDKELMELSKNTRIYAIAERSALVRDEAGISFFGTVHLFYRSKKTRCS